LPFSFCTVAMLYMQQQTRWEYPRYCIPQMWIQETHLFITAWWIC
jgi:hypothetical protein